MVTSNRFKVPRISVLFSMVGVFLLSMVSFQGKAQCNVNQKYDKIVSGYHSSIALSDNGNYLAWGQDIANDGATDQAGPPKALISSNYPSLTGTVLFTTIGGPGSGGKDQFIALTTTGLFAWGAVGSSTTGILSPTLKATTAFGLITTPTGGDAVTKLPTGVSTSQVTMMIGMYQALAIVANGNVWVLSQSDANIQGDGTSLASTTWHKVKTSAGVDLTNVTEIRGQLADGTTSAIMALTSTGLAYTWGTSTYLGNGTASVARNYATQMTLPAEFTSSNKPKMIGVTGGTNSSVVSNSYFVLSNSGALYALGDNHAKQLGDFTTTERTSWVNVKSAAATNFTNVNFISVQEHTGKMASAALITKTGVLYSWGDNDGNMIGRTSDGTSTGSAGTTYDPGNPVGFVVGVDKALFTEMGGHTLVYVKEGSSTFCYVGHRTNGSMGESTTSSGTVVSFDCTNTPAISLCGAVPIAADPTKSVISASPTTITANGTSTSTITIQLKNSSGANLTTTGGEVVVTTTAGTLGTVVDNNNGTYTVILTSSNTVTSTTIGFSINGTTATGANSTATVSFISGGSTPSITTSGTTSAFTTCINTASTAQNFTVAGTDLTADLTITAPTGFQIATISGGTYSNTLIVPASSGTVSTTTIWVRLTGVTSGTFTGSVDVSSTGATLKSVSVSGTVNAATAVGTITGGDVIVCSGTNNTTLTLVGSTGTIQWQSSTDNSTFTNITGATSATYTATNLNATTYYKAAVTSGSCSASLSAPATITVIPVSVAGSISGATTVCTGTNNTVLTLVGSTGTIQWQSSTDNSTFTNITGATSATYSATNLTATTYYKAVVTSGACSAATTSASTIIVSPVSVAGTISGATTVCAGTNNTVLTLVGSTGTIQWQSSTDNTTFTNISGATSATYTATNLTATTYYKAAVTSGSCSASISAPATITVIPVSVAGSISGATTVCTGTNNTALTLVGSTGTIQWQSSTDNSTFTNITGATSATYTATNLTATTYYKAVVTSGACSAATTSASTITVSPVSVAGTISGGNVSVCLGSANSTTMTLAGYVGAIQWQSSTDNINFTNISGATNASFTATNLAVTTYYKAVVTSGACSYSATASVAITVSQCIVANPDINTTNVNTNVSGNLNTNDKITSGTSYGPLNPASTNPSGGSLTLNANGSYTFNTSLPGRYIYYVQVCGAGQTTGCAVAPLEITVIDPNSTSNAPIVKNDYTTTQVNTPVNVRVLSNDRVVNAGTSLLANTVSIVSAPNNGTASVNSATGVVTFTPNTGFAGTDSLNYKVCDNSTTSNCQIATVYFKVSSSSVAEYTTADDDFNNVNMNSTVSGNVLTNDVNSANNTLTVTSNSTPLSTQGTIRINTDGSYTFTPTANFFGPLDITYTACTNGSVCATATLHILVSPIKPAAPTVAGGAYVSKDPTNPANIGSTVSNIPAGSKAIYCDINGLSCSTTTPVIPMNPGIYIWCVKSLDTITNLTSSPCIYDTISVLPYVKVVNATYVNGVATNPKNIAVLISDISAGSIAKWCNVAGSSCTTTAPSLPTIIGKSVWCVKAIDTASGLSSIICKMDTVTILDPYTVMELSKSATSVKLNPDGTILLNFVLKAINKTDGSIDSVSIKDDLTRTFNTSRGILVYSLDAYGGLVKNVGYDGIANIELLDPSSKLAAKRSDSIVLKVLLESPDVSGTLNNSATLTGKTKYGKFSVISNDPLSNPSDSTIRIATSFKVPKVDVIVAGGFSPNQDGMNDKWIIVRPFGTIIQVKVFNRWGNLVYENENYTNDWDGRGQGNFMGQYLPEGTYFYMVEATDANGNVQKFAKSLTIVR